MNKFIYWRYNRFMITAIYKSVRIAGFTGVIAAACAVHLSAANLKPPPPPAYTITDLGTLPGSDFSQALSINNAGQIVGVSGTHPWLYTNGKIVDLGLLPGLVKASEVSVNNQGLITGIFNRLEAYDPISPNHIPPEKSYANTSFTYWKENMRAIPIPRPYIGMVTSDSNDKNQIVGFVQVGLGNDRPILIEGQRIRMLPLPGGYRSGDAAAINNRGVIAASASKTAGDPYKRAYVIWNGKARLLGSIGGSESQSFGINDRGEIVGSAATSRDDDHFNTIMDAFVWDSRHGMKDIGSFGGTYTEAMSINNLSQIVGQSQLSSKGKEKQIPNSMADLEYLRPHAFLWQKGHMYDLNDLITPKLLNWTLECASAINDHGVIVGWGAIGSENHAFMLSPVKTVAQSGQTPRLSTFPCRPARRYLSACGACREGRVMCELTGPAV